MAIKLIQTREDDLRCFKVRAIGFKEVNDFRRHVGNRINRICESGLSFIIFKKGRNQEPKFLYLCTSLNINQGQQVFNSRSENIGLIFKETELTAWIKLG